MVHYYQVCGFESHTGQWERFRYDIDYKGLAYAIAGNDSPLKSQTKASVELVLGMQHCGATNLLMTGPQMEAIAGILNLPPLRNPRLAARYQSLSPIYFRNSEELASKLLTYVIKYKKGKPHNKDESQANRSFVFSGGQDGVPRGRFEHQRVFYRITNDDIDLPKFGLSDVSWMGSVRLFSLVFNTWHMDYRPAQDRLHHPMVIDIGWTEISLPEYITKNGTSVHIANARNAKLGKRKPFEYGTTETLDVTVISSRLQDIFTKAQGSDQPVILLVDGEEQTRCALQSIGIDVSRWENGIKSLLGYDAVKEQNPSGFSRSNDQSSYPRNRRPRSRSRSPRRERHNDGPPGPSRLDQYSSSSAFRRKSPYRRYQDATNTRLPHNGGERMGLFAPVYIVDVRQMFIKVSGNNNPGQLSDIAHRVGRLGEIMPGSCAGNECHMLLDIWLEMVRGPTIDEQTARWSTATTTVTPTAGPSKAAESEDPNDFVPSTAAAVTSVYEDFDNCEDDDSDDD